jgi:hypothetical protein
VSIIPKQILSFQGESTAQRSVWIDRLGEGSISGTVTLHVSYKYTGLLTFATQIMSYSESSPLLENGHHSDTAKPPFTSRAVSFLKGEGEPSWPQSLKFFIFGTWFNILLVFIPLSFVSHYLNWDAGLRFICSFIAILPLAKVSTHS